MTTDPTPWPSSEEYNLAHRCPTCHAEPGAPCVAPRKGRTHLSRQDSGRRHYYRDVGNAPWPEDREPGVRYATLPRADPALDPATTAPTTTEASDTMTPIDPVTDTWTCCGRPRLTNRCTANPASSRYGDEPGMDGAGFTPPATCRDCGVHLGQHHHHKCCIAACRRCEEQQLMCGCRGTGLEVVG